MANLLQQWETQTARFPMLGKIFSSFGWNAFFKVFHLSVRFYVGARVAQYFGPEKMGVFSSAWASFAIIAPLVLGIDSVINVRLVESPRGARRHLGTLLGYKCITGAIAIAVVVVIAFSSGGGAGHRFGADTYQIVLLILGVQFVTQLLDTQTVWFAARLESRFVAWGNFGGLIVSSIIQLALVASGASLALFAIAVVTELLIARLFTTYYFRSRGPKMRTWKVHWQPLWETIKVAWPMIVAALLASIYARMDILMLQAVAGDFETGIYAAAVRISELFWMIPGLLCAALVPSLVRAKGWNSELYHRRLQSLFCLMAFFGYVSIAVIWCVGGRLISIFYGEEFNASHSILLIHLWVVVPMALGVALSHYLVSKGFLKFALVSNLVGALVNLGLNVVLIPRYGGWGAAIATLVACFIANIGMTLLYRPVRRAGLSQLTALLVPNPFKIASLSSQK